MNKAFEEILSRLEDLKLPFPDKCYGGNTNDLIEETRKVVEKVAEEYNNGWIPCSEGVPEECMEVLVSVKEIDDSIYITTSWMEDGEWVIKKTPLQPTIIAWQPLPEPYHPKEETEAGVV